MSQYLYEFFVARLVRKDDDRYEFPAEAASIFSESLSLIEKAAYLPLFMKKIPDAKPEELRVFFDIFLVYIVCRAVELRINVLRQIQTEGTFLTQPSDTIGKMADVEFFNTF